MGGPRPFLAFISYAHRHAAWVRTLHGHLELALEHAGRPGKIFLDDVDLAAGRSWVSQLEAGLEKAKALQMPGTGRLCKLPGTGMPATVPRKPEHAVRRCAAGGQVSVV